MKHWRSRRGPLFRRQLGNGIAYQRPATLPNAIGKISFGISSYRRAFSGKTRAGADDIPPDNR